MKKPFFPRKNPYKNYTTFHTFLLRIYRYMCTYNVYTFIYINISCIFKTHTQGKKNQEKNLNKIQTNRQYYFVSLSLLHVGWSCQLSECVVFINKTRTLNYSQNLTERRKKMRSAEEKNKSNGTHTFLLDLFTYYSELAHIYMHIYV